MTVITLPSPVDPAATFLDPVIPVGCKAVEELTESLSFPRIVYDVASLSDMAKIVTPFVTGTTVGCVWRMGESANSAESVDPASRRRLFVNSESFMKDYPDLVPFRDYARGITSVNRLFGMTGLDLMSPKEPQVEFTVDESLDRVHLDYTVEAVYPICARWKARRTRQAPFRTTMT